MKRGIKKNAALGQLHVGFTFIAVFIALYKRHGEVIDSREPIGELFMMITALRLTSINRKISQRLMWQMFG